jgi:hypothetical protein
VGERIMAKEKIKKTPPFSDTIYVTRVQDGDDSWLNANDDLNQIVSDDGESVVVAIYRFEKTVIARRVVQVVTE